MIKGKNIFEIFYRDIYTIEYQKRSLFHIHFLIFLYREDQFYNLSQINKIIYAKLSIVEFDLIREFIKVVTLIILYSLYGDINPHSSYISNAQDSLPKYTKHYF